MLQSKEALNPDRTYGLWACLSGFAGLLLMEQPLPVAGGYSPRRLTQCREPGVLECNLLSNAR